MNALKQTKSTNLNVLNLKNVSIRTFRITSISFFLCFFLWFGIAAASSAAVSQGYLVIGFVVIITGIVALAIRFSSEDEKVANTELKESLGKLALVKVTN